MRRRSVTVTEPLLIVRGTPLPAPTIDEATDWYWAHRHDLAEAAVRARFRGDVTVAVEFDRPALRAVAAGYHQGELWVHAVR